MSNLSLSALFDSTRALHERFGVKPDAILLGRLLMEETYEVLLAVAMAHRDDWTDEHDVVSELADVIFVCVGIAEAHQAGDLLEESLRAVIAKNAAKTHATHELVNGKITRREV